MKSLLLMTLLAVQSEVPIVHEVVEVRVANFDVVVTDRAGKHVRGLTAADFELLEDGNPQEITNLTEYSGGPGRVGEAPSEGAAEAPPARQIVIFIDLTSTDTFERKRACTALEAFLDGLGKDDQATVISWNRTMKIVVPATNDRQKLKEGLKSVRSELSLSRVDQLRAESMRGGSASERRVAQQVAARMELADARQAATALKTVLTRLGGLSGRRALLLVTKSFAHRIEDEIDDPVDRDVLRSIAETANAAGVTVYGVHAGGVSSGVSVDDPFIGDSIPAGAWRTRLDAASVDGLRFLAGQTGGRVAANTNYFTNALDAIAGDLTNYYSIGYRVRARRVRGEKEIVIRTKKGEYTVRARRAFVERTYEQDVAHQLLANLYFPDSGNQLGISAAPGPSSRTKKNRFAVPIDVKIPYANLSFVPSGDADVADLAVFIGSVDRTGSASSILRYQQTIRVRRAELAALATKQYTYSFDVDLHTIPGDQRFAVAVLDNTSKVAGYATVEVKGLK